MRPAWLLACAAAVVLAGCAAPPPGPEPPPPGGTDGGTQGTRQPPPPPAPADPPERLRLRFHKVAGDLEQPVGATHAGDGSGRLFIVEQAGRVRVLANGSLADGAWLDVTGAVSTGGERGLLGLAFAPDARNAFRVYAHFTDRDGHTALVRYEAAANATTVDSSRAERLLRVEQPYANHNGGTVAFGPDGMLYLFLGDGGYGSDPHDHAQNPASLLGKALRLDVRGAEGYAIPPDNPFARGGGAPEVWALGLRNPWRASFDRLTGDLYIADVGQREVEEIDFQPAGARGGANYGWRVWEGSSRHRPNETAAGEVTFPVAEYRHKPGGHCAVTGGHVYRGAASPGLRGVYLFGDYCSGVVWGLWRDGAQWRTRQLADTDFRISSFGEDEAGEVLLVDHGGGVYRIAAEM